MPQPLDGRHSQSDKNNETSRGGTDHPDRQHQNDNPGLSLFSSRDLDNHSRASRCRTIQDLVVLELVISDVTSTKSAGMPQMPDLEQLRGGAKSKNNN